MSQHLWARHKKQKLAQNTFFRRQWKRLPCKSQTSLWERVCRLTWTGYENMSASAVSGKQRDPVCQGYFTALRHFSVNIMIPHHLQNLTVCTHQCIELWAIYIAPYWCKHKSAWETWDLQSLHTYCANLQHPRCAHTHPQTHTFTLTHSKQSSNSQSSCRLGRLFCPVAYFWRWISRAPWGKRLFARDVQER